MRTKLAALLALLLMLTGCGPTEADPRYATCGQARTAGHGPYHKDDPEYGWYRDTDGDGTVCEAAAAGSGQAALALTAPPGDGCDIPTGVAHRGGTPAYTENALLAYTNVWAWGVNDWETDIRFDATGIPVLMHDATVNRTTTGTGSVSAITWSSSAITMTDGQLLKNQTLDRLLQLAAAKHATVAIEPKVVPNTNQVSRVLALLDKYGMRDRVLLDSFEVANLAPFKAAAPDLTYGLVSTTAVTPQAAAAVGPILNIAASALTEQLVDDYHAAGVAVYAWTLDTPAQWAPQRNWGIDRYVTNQVKDYRAWRDWVCRGDVWDGDL